LQQVFKVTSLSSGHFFLIYLTVPCCILLSLLFWPIHADETIEKVSMAEAEDAEFSRMTV
jgi:hypothetical protein